MDHTTSTLASFRKALRIGLRAAWEFSPGLSFLEVVILLHTPFESVDQLADAIGVNRGEAHIYTRSLLAAGLLTHSGDYSLTQRGAALFLPASRNTETGSRTAAEHTSRTD